MAVDVHHSMAKVCHRVFIVPLLLLSIGFKQQPDIMKYAIVLVLSNYLRLNSVDL